MEICEGAGCREINSLSGTRPHRIGAAPLSNNAQYAHKILVIDNDRQIRRFVNAGLELYGFSVIEAENAATGLNAATIVLPHLIIFDPALPDMNGAEFLQAVRSWSNVPVIILSIRSEEEQKVQFLRAGADDYVTKPFGIVELAARCEAALRRRHNGVDKDPVVRTGPLTINLITREVTLDGKYVTLARQEYRLLHLLASKLGLVISHDELIHDIWGDASPNNVRYLRTLVRKLRQKIEADPGWPQLVISESGVGYRLERNIALLPRARDKDTLTETDTAAATWRTSKSHW
jgi:two-component system, OmpR family, KDP operon response regulator KdpE